MRIGRLPFFYNNTDGKRLNHAVVLNVIARTDIDLIAVESVLQY
jgi:hypothetical protein